ncbi:hypothetical protein [Pontibacter rugosus]|uniref:Uncharacterized protein n=1 Tax=Pontibacter rugosus TaxID=1745966 RepID=A0ABW3SLS9_9BACT
MAKFIQTKSKFNEPICINLDSVAYAKFNSDEDEPKLTIAFDSGDKLELEFEEAQRVYNLLSSF